MSRHNQKMDYWGGSIPGSYKCQCGVIGDCKDPTKWCNCDSGRKRVSSFLFALCTYLLLIVFTFYFC